MTDKERSLEDCISDLVRRFMREYDSGSPAPGSILDRQQRAIDALDARLDKLESPPPSEVEKDIDLAGGALVRVWRSAEEDQLSRAMIEAARQYRSTNGLNYKAFYATIEALDAAEKGKEKK